jgi:hypothetical protein
MRISGDARTAIALGSCVLLGNYCFVSLVYVASQVEQNAYAMKFWFKSLVRFPLSSTLGFAVVYLPVLAVVATLAPRLISTLKSQNIRITFFTAYVLVTFLVVGTTLQLSLYQRLSWNVQNVALLLITHCVGAGLAMAMAPRDGICKA